MPRMEVEGNGMDTRALEALLFVSDEPLTPSVITQRISQEWKPGSIRILL